MIIWEHESVPHPYSAFFKGNVPSSSNMSSHTLILCWSNHIGYGHPQHKSQKGLFVWARASARVCRGLTLVNEYDVGSITVNYGYCDWQLCVLHWTHRSLNSEKRCHSDVTTSARQHLSNSLGLLICYANDCCLMHKQFSVTQMVRWQKTGCYKIALYEWVSHEHSIRVFFL